MEFFYGYFMKKIIILFCLIGLVNSGYGQQFTLSDFFKYDAVLAQKTDSVFSTLNDTTRVGQMIVAAAGRLGKPDSEINSLIKKQMLGGVILLNGSKQGFTEMTKRFKAINPGVPLVFSADAEPTLIGSKIKGTTPVKKANAMVSRAEVLYYTQLICKNLKQVGITYNYAPVVDMSPNKTVSTRSFGNSPDTAQIWANIFIKETQKNGIVATAKHFPGHGYVVGDTHEKLLTIDGEMREVGNYVPLINSGVLSIMVAHIAVKNNANYNTNGLPSSCSREIVTGLLKNKLKFKGIVITDAMNMGGVYKVKNCELLAAKAGCDLILMPVNEHKAIMDIVNHMNTSEKFRQQIYASVKKIIRLKFCLGLFK